MRCPTCGHEHSSDIFDITVAQCAPQPSGEQAETFSADDAWHDLVEKDDRNSPEDYPEMCLITFEELRDYMQRAAPAAVLCAAREALAEWVAVRQDMNGMALLGKDKDESDEQRKVREAKWTRLGHAEHALMAAALSLPAAGGEASKREVE